MAVGLPATGTLKYNGYEFDGASKITVKSEPVRDDAGLTQIYRRYTITVQCVIADGGGTDADLFQIRSQLAEDGKELIFVSKGFGTDLRVNAGGHIQDVKLGPKPDIIDWKPIGNNLACEVTWTVIVCVPECQTANIRRTGVMASNYEISFGINEYGDTVRTIAGYIEVVQVRLLGGKILDSADRYRGLAGNNAPPAGFTRTSDWTTSADKSRCNFTITDTQIPSPNPYPKNVTAISARHTVQSGLAQRGGFHRRRNIISAEITMKDGISISQAWSIFLEIVRQRVLKARQYSGEVLIDSVLLEEGIFSRTASFECGYQVTESATDILRGSGLWEPIAGTRWESWLESIKECYLPYGTANLFHNPQHDLIVDLCGEAPPIPTGGIESGSTAPRVVRTSGINNSLPPPESSHIDYENLIVPERRVPIIQQSVLQESQTDLQEGSTNPAGATIRIPVFTMGPPAATPAVIQKRGAPRYKVRMRGTARRVGYPIPRPSIPTVGSQVAHELKSKYAMNVIGTFFGVRVYGAAWDVTYLLENSPGVVTPFPNSVRVS